MSPRLYPLLPLHSRRPCRPERRRRRSPASGSILVTHTDTVSKVVSNRCSSHLYSHNRVDDVSNDLLTHIRRVRRCQKQPLRIPKNGYLSLFPVPSSVLTLTASRSAEDRKGGEACQRQEEHWRAQTAFVCIHVLLPRLEREDQG